jgi:hypothetical protein
VGDADGGVRRAARRASSRLAALAWREANQAVAGPKGDVARQLGALADVLREGERRLGSERRTLGLKAGTAADRVERAARYLRDADLEALLGDLESFARRRPVTFVGGAFLAGFVLARVVRSADERRTLAHGA